MTAFNHTFSLLEYDSGNLHVTVGRLIKGRSNHLSINCTSHIGDFLWTFVDKKHHDVSLRMVGSYSVGDILHQYCFTSLGLGYY